MICELYSFSRRYLNFHPTAVLKGLSVAIQSRDNVFDLASCVNN